MQNKRITSRLEGGDAGDAYRYGCAYVCKEYRGWRWLQEKKPGTGRGQEVVVKGWGRNCSLCLEKIFIITCMYCFIRIELNLKILKHYLIPLSFSVCRWTSPGGPDTARSSPSAPSEAGLHFIALGGSSPSVTRRHLLSFAESGFGTSRWSVLSSRGCDSSESVEEEIVPHRRL